jgi:chemotaxis signal transduction protein
MTADSIIPPVRADEPPVETVFDHKAGKYLTFRVARQDFAMNAESVRGILPMHELIAREASHEWLCGSAAIGGRDVPVIDLKIKLGIAEAAQGREPFIIIVAARGRLAGFIADRVSEVLDVRQRDFRNGALRGHGRLRRVLDSDQIITEEDWAELRIHAAY